MVFEKNLKCSSSEFYDVVMNSLLHEVNAYREEGSEEISIEQLKVGVAYFKPLNRFTREVRTRVEIVALEKNVEYSAKVETGESKFYISYQITELEEGGINVVYSESSEYSRILRKTNEKVVGFFKRKSFAKRISTMLSSIEDYIILNRGK